MHGPGGPGVVDCRRAAALSKNGKRVEGGRDKGRGPGGPVREWGGYADIAAWSQAETKEFWSATAVEADEREIRRGRQGTTSDP